MVHQVLRMIDEVRRAGSVCDDDECVYRASTKEHTLVTYSDIADDDVARVVMSEVSRAREGSRTLEWDIFGHDPQTRLPESLIAAGFVAEPMERVLVGYATATLLEQWDTPHHEVRRVRDVQGIADVAKVSREVGRKNVDAESQLLAASLREATPQTWAYVAHANEEPVACGRLHFASTHPIAWLAGGRTTPAFRRRGLYLALVRQRIEDAIAQGCVAVIVDALPTSEPILSKRGFEAISEKQAFVLDT